MGPAPFVRVEDASLHPDGGPVRVTVSRLASPEGVADALAAAGARTWMQHGRLTTVTTASRLVDAVGRASGRPDADALATILDGALAGWHGPTPDLVTPMGVLTCRSRPLVMGVLNVTPDSFSDGAAFYDPSSHPERAVAHGLRLIEEGADIIDVGGESSRPGAEAVAEEEELRRVIPVVKALAGQGAVVSIDTAKAAVARAAVEVGAAMINDVSAGALDEELLPAVADLRVPYVLMHMRGTPQTMQDDLHYDDVVAEVFDFLAQGLERCTQAGIDPTRIVVDPGIGFGKAADHNLQLLRRLREFTSLARPVLIGASRKSFLGRVTGIESPAERIVCSVAAAVMAVANGARMVRVHDVGETQRAVAVATAITG